LGLAFYVGENRFRAMGDSLNCCGTDGIPDWVPNRCNLNHLFWGGYTASPAQQEPGSSDVFGSLYQDAGGHQMIRSVSFEQCLQEVARSEDQRYVMGLLTPVVEEGLF